MRQEAKWLAIAGATALAFLAAITADSLRPLPDTLRVTGEHLRFTARDGTPLTTTYQNAWNVHDFVPLYRVPPFLQTAFIASEDRRFREHGGVDWQARLAALGANMRHMRAVRGASTVSEQVVRMLHPRPRTLWSRWVEGFEAQRLERQFSKDEILEFYLNQIPYASNRRGIAQAARHYFDRDLDTLSRKEMLALVVLVRAPSRLDLYDGTRGAEAAIARLTAHMQQLGLMEEGKRKAILAAPLTLRKPTLAVAAPHFIAATQREAALAYAGTEARTTLDPVLQAQVQALLDARLAKLAGQNLRHGAVLVADHRTGAVLAWAVGDNGSEKTTIDAVSTPRQPGSALKPFLYARALEKGWTAATPINDAPLTESVGAGLHSYQNYSRSFYGRVSLREALGNSLNIPALKALQFVGGADYLAMLHRLGFAGLNERPNVYGDGLALGNGAVTLRELVQAYATLANRGRLRPLRLLADDPAAPALEVVDAPVASLMGDILSDPKARKLEFGEHSVLNLPVQTAVKTGTSSDYRDAWAVGFNARHVVGIWMGNLDQTPTDGVTGSTGPALLLRSVFAELTRGGDSHPLWLSPALEARQICRDTLETGEDCNSYSEWFVAGTAPAPLPQDAQPPIRLRRPTQGLNLAYDPRIPAASQSFEFFIQGLRADDEVRWRINGREVVRRGGAYAWPVTRGRHEVSATVLRGSIPLTTIAPVRFIVK